jgi:flagellar basal body L-ring protein FlgH
MAPESSRYKNGYRATARDFVDDSKNDGSLWASDGQTNYFFTKNKVRAVGDIITIVSEPDFVRDMGIEIARTLSPSERDQELELAQERLNKSDSLKTSAASPDGSPAGAGAPGRSPAVTDSGESVTRTATAGDIDVRPSMEFKAGDPIMAEIVERFPNGNYKIRGSKKVPYRGTFRYVNMLAVVRGTDISDNDTVKSGKLYEYRLEAVR